MIVCYFGIYDSGYSRNKILISGLKLNGVEVIECRTDKKGIIKYFELIIRHWKIRKNYDVMVVGYPGFQPAILAKFLTRKPIVFDAYLSLYDSVVLDRKKLPLKCFKAKYYWWLDKISMNIVNIVILDTNEHIKFVADEFNVPNEKLKRIFIGADTNIFFPRGLRLCEQKSFKVLFFGNFIPLQGIEYIVKAAKELEGEKDIVFEIIGDGQEKQKILKISKKLKVSNVIFKDSLPQKNLPDSIAKADVCLGIFGNTNKTQRVIPNKVFECVASEKAVITADTPAERELFADSDISFVKTANHKSIAAAILKLKSNKSFLEEIARNGYKKFLQEVNINKLGLQLSYIIKEIYEQEKK